MNKNDNANKTSTGFIYQDLVFIKKLLYLEDDGTKITHELFDDVSVIKKNSLELVQVKHSINDDISLTDRSFDLWKTLSKWSKILIKDNCDSLEFIFYTNKKLSKTSNKILSELKKVEKNYLLIQKYINEVFEDLDEKEKAKGSNTKENPIFKYVKEIKSLDLNKQKILFSKLSIILSENKIVDDIKKKIEFFGIEKDYIDMTYEQLLGIITQHRYKLAKENKDFIVDYEYFRNELKFNRLLKTGKFTPLKFDKYFIFDNYYDEDFSEEIFYKQLVDINIPNDEINDYANERARTSAFFEKELQILPSEEKIIDSMIKEEWEEHHTKLYKGKEASNKKAHKCLDKTQNSYISFESNKLPKKLVKGKMIDLSNKPVIGWKKNWKELYYE